MNKDLKMFYKNYVAKGWSCVPVNSQDKSGSLISGWKEFQKRIPTSDEINKWSNKFPDAGIGIITGKNSGIIVLDIDPRNDGHKSIKDKKIPPTISIKTGGGGTHYYFKYPENKTINSYIDILPGVDLKADGGMVYAPPSIHPSGNEYRFYTFMGINDTQIADPPDWLIKLIKRKQIKKSKPITAKDWKQEIKPGNRNNKLTRLAGSLIGQDMDKNIVFETINSYNNNYCKPPLPKSEISSIINSIYSREQNTRLKDLLKKINKIRKLDKIQFKPFKLAKYIISYLKYKKNMHIKYMPSKDMFRYYKNGVWNLDDSYEYFIKKEIRKFIVKIDKSRFNRDNKIKEILSNIKVIQEMKNPDHFNAFNQPKDIINLKNGILHLDTMELKEHDHKLFSIFQFPIKYDAEAKCPLWEKTLKEWIEDQDTINFLQEYVGYLLIPNTSAQKFPILIGEGSNGKSVFLKVVKSILGNNISSNNIKQIAGKSQKFNLINLFNKLANICNDIGNNTINNPETIELITSGDEITANIKYKAPIKFTPVARLLFAANEIPESSDKNHSWFRRLEIVRFANKFSPTDKNYDPNLAKKLLKELPGILNWAIEGLQRFRENKTLNTSIAMKIEKNKHRETFDPVIYFLNQYIEQTRDVENDIIATQKLYDMYIEWCKNLNYPADITKNKFSRELGKQKIKTSPRRINNGKQERAYLGIKFK